MYHYYWNSTEIDGLIPECMLQEGLTGLSICNLKKKAEMITWMVFSVPQRTIWHGLQSLVFSFISPNSSLPQASEGHLLSIMNWYETILPLRIIGLGLCRASIQGLLCLYWNLNKTKFKNRLAKIYFFLYFCSKVRTIFWWSLQN